MSVVTPLIFSPFLSKSSGFNVYLKLENTQPSGSFKLRGISHLIRTNIAKGGNNAGLHVYCSSGGNAGLAAAYFSMLEGVPCTVCLPSSTSDETVDRLTLFKAEVIKHGDFWADADKHLREVIIPKCPTTAVYCHPFDDPLLFEGHSAMIDEIKTQLPAGIEAPAAISVAVGGGGLYMGVATGLKRYSWAESVPIIVVEPKGASAFAQSLRAGGVSVRIAPDTSIKCLAADYAVPEAIDFGMNINPTKSIVISDECAIDSARQFARDHKFIVESACGAALAPFYNPDILAESFPELEKGSLVVVVVCGGTAAQASDYA